jgi:SAM-dependent methyltransferase
MSLADNACPVCGRSNLVPTVQRSTLPGMQNYVYRTRPEALAARSGRFDLRACESCGLAFNSSYDPKVLTYDSGYDNSVPSAMMDAYYRQIASYLNEKYLHDNGLIVDIGCGKGTFLKQACAFLPGIHGLGIDPSYEDAGDAAPDRLSFIKDFFSPRYLTERPALVVCRHVMEHIERPVEFLSSLRKTLTPYPDVPLFFETPDLDWIIRNRAFWDFCYEHCNYFTGRSLSRALELSGFQTTKTTPAFGGQYLWIECAPAGQPALPAGASAQPSDIAAALRQYAAGEAGLIAQVRSKLLEHKRRGAQIALWGMATKGVIFSLLADPDGSLIDYCVDINKNKQGCFVPLTGRRIGPPDALPQGKALTIVVMNPNYIDEIKALCGTIGVGAVFIDAGGMAI